MSGPDYPRRARGTASRLVAGEAVVIVPARHEAHVLNGPGSAAWALMDGKRARPEIARALSERYRVSGETAARDLDGFIAKLIALGAAEAGESPSPSSAPEPELPDGSAYEPPTVAETQALEVVAALCSSLREGAGGGKPKPPGTCRTLGACQKPFE